MNKTKLKYVKYTKQELDKYVRDKNSCISLVNSEMHVGFPPWGFASFQETLTNIISRDKIGKYDSKLDGIVLDIRNIKVFGTTYPVHDDDAYNHINIKANFYIFQPRVGVIIRGIVKHISHGHVAAIIYRVFNVSIRFNRAETRETLSINQQISFRIKNFDLHGAMPYIEGELIKVDQPKKTPDSVRRQIRFDGNGDSGISTEETSANDKPRVKKFESSSEEDSDADSDDDSSNASNERLADQLFSKVKVKQEKLSDSENERNRRRATRESSTSSSSEDDDEEEDDTKQSSYMRRIKQEKPSESESDSSSSDEESSDDDTFKHKPIPLEKIKKEKQSESSTSSSESSDSDSDDSPPRKQLPPVKNIKRERNVDEPSTSTFLTPLRRNIKAEPVSDVEDRNSFKKPQTNDRLSLNRTSRKRTSSMSDQLESLVGEVLNRSDTRNGHESGAKSKKSKPDAENSNQSFADLSTTRFQSPALSSTIKPNSKEKTPLKIKKEPQSEDESSKKKKTKTKDLGSMEGNLFDSFLK